METPLKYCAEWKDPRVERTPEHLLEAILRMVLAALDLDRKRRQNSAQNFSLLNRMALNLLRQDRTTKLGIKGKRLKAGWDNDYLLK